MRSGESGDVYFVFASFHGTHLPALCLFRLCLVVIEMFLWAFSWDFNIPDTSIFKLQTWWHSTWNQIPWQRGSIQHIAFYNPWRGPCQGAQMGPPLKVVSAKAFPERYLFLLGSPACLELLQDCPVVVFLPHLVECGPGGEEKVPERSQLYVTRCMAASSPTMFASDSTACMGRWFDM